MPLQKWTFYRVSPCENGLKKVQLTVVNSVVINKLLDHMN